MNVQNTWSLLKETGSEWMEDKAPRLGAALAYYTAFSLAPLLVIVIGIAGLVLHQQNAGDHVINQIESMVGEQGGEAVRTMVEAFPFVPLASNVRVGVAIFSYNGLLNYGVTGDYDTAPDIAVLCAGVEAGMAELLKLAQ